MGDAATAHHPFGKILVPPGPPLRGGHGGTGCVAPEGQEGRSITGRSLIGHQSSDVSASTGRFLYNNTLQPQTSTAITYNTTDLLFNILLNLLVCCGGCYPTPPPMLISPSCLWLILVSLCNFMLVSINHSSSLPPQPLRRIFGVTYLKTHVANKCPPHLQTVPSH